MSLIPKFLIVILIDSLSVRTPVTGESMLKIPISFWFSGSSQDEGIEKSSV